jgi:translation initiation factor IF-2
MPIRIYALAKELNIDSKNLVDICAKAGVTGKGSALASLTDEEIERVKAYLSSGKQRPVTGGVRTATIKPVVDRAISRDDYIGPGGAAGQAEIRRIGAAKETAPAKPGDHDRSKLKREPVVKLAAIPEATQPPPAAPAVEEPAPQKPIMTLPKEAIRGAKEGLAAPLQQFTRHHERKRRQEEGLERAAPPLGLAPPVADLESLKGRGGRGRRKGKDVSQRDEEEEGKAERDLAGMASARATRQQSRKRRPPKQISDDEPTLAPRRRTARLTRKGTNTAAPRKHHLVVDLPCTIRTFSEATGIPSTNILRSLMALGTTVSNINAELDQSMAEMIAAEADVEVEFRHAISLEETVLAEIDRRQDRPEDLLPRPPIVTFLGHVDHGKTSLLDRIIGTNVVSGEAGGITQHIRAYSIRKDGRTISFVDTPGHEAFTEMRARGANVTDVAVLVVAADDGVMPQTEEAISHAKAAGVPIVVALNKIDLPGIDVNRVMQELSTHELLPSEWGGDVEVVKTSALTGKGIDDLLETLLLTADIHEFKANPNLPAVGTCLEAEQEAGRGVVAKLIVQKGTLAVGDVIVCGAAYGRVKAMYNTLNRQKKTRRAGPSIPVNVTGLDVAPQAGERFYVLKDIAQAREIAEQRLQRSRTQSLAGRSTRISFEEFQRRLDEGLLAAGDGVAVLNLILRADVRGSIEAIQKELGKLQHPEVQIKILQASVGGITVADVTLADASDAVIVGFNVIPDENARALAEERGVEIRRYDVIYKVTEDIKSMLEGKLKPEEHITELGRALVQEIFSISRIGTVAGCRVLAGNIERGCRVRVNREGRRIGDYWLESLRREKDDAKEVREGFECGMKLAGFNDVKQGDVLEAYKIEEVARTL